MVDRPLPTNIEAEQWVLGSMLRDGEVVGDVVGMLSEVDFAREVHRVLYRAMVGMYEKGKGIDAGLVRQAIDGDHAKAAEYVLELMKAVPVAANAEHYARIVRDTARLRGLMVTGYEAVREAGEAEPDEADDVLGRAEERVLALSGRKNGTEAAPFSPALQHAFDTAAASDHPHTGQTTGWLELDDLTGGLQPGEMIVVAARPSVGKTAFAMQMVEHVALEGGKALVFSLEMSRQALAHRMLCCRAKVDAHKARRRRCNAAELGRLADAVAAFDGKHVWVNDGPGQDPWSIRSEARRFHRRHGLSLIVVDYLQLMGGKGETRQQEVAWISRQMKAMAAELRVPVVAVCQLNRLAEHRANADPRLSDLRDSGQIEQDADVVLLLHRESLEADRATVHLAKQRNGPTGNMTFAFLRASTRFEPAHWRDDDGA